MSEAEGNSADFRAGHEAGYNQGLDDAIDIVKRQAPSIPHVGQSGEAVRANLIGVYEWTMSISERLIEHKRRVQEHNQKGEV